MARRSPSAACGSPARGEAAHTHPKAGAAEGRNRRRAGAAEPRAEIHAHPLAAPARRTREVAGVAAGIRRAAVDWSWATFHCGLAEPGRITVPEGRLREAVRRDPRHTRWALR